MLDTLHQPDAAWCGLDPRLIQCRPASHTVAKADVAKDETWHSNKFHQMHPPADKDVHVPSQLIRVIELNPDSKAGGPAQRSEDPDANVAPTGGLHRTFTTSTRDLGKLLPEALSLPDLPEQPAQCRE